MSVDTNKSTTNIKTAEGYSHSDEHSIIFNCNINKITSFIKSATEAKDESIFINSPKFSTGAKIKDLWYLELEIKEDDGTAKLKSSISLYLQSSNDNRRIQTKYLLFLLNNKGEKIVTDLKIYSQSSDEWIDHLFVRPNGYGWERFVKINELLERKDEFFNHDTLTICINLIVYDNYVTVSNSLEPLKYFKRKLSEDLKDLFVSKRKCDVSIKVAGQNFDAHKLILIARSSVFEAMFSHDMKESKENEVNISDIDPQIFEKVLDYIYTDEVDELDSFAEELLEASDKYQLHGLKELCEHSLSKTLTLGNAIRVMILADRHNAKRLKELSINYVVTNFIKLKNTEKYKSLEKVQQSLLLAVLKKYADRAETK